MKKVYNMNWYKIAQNDNKPTNELELLAIPENKRTWRMIEDIMDPDGKQHDLRLKCVRCGNEQTCRCSKSKRKFLGICNSCYEKIKGI